jgi:hypothetical protein
MFGHFVSVLFRNLTQDGRVGLEVRGARMVPHATKVPVPSTTGFLISHWVSLFYVEHVEYVLPTHHHYFLNPTGGSTHFYVEIISRTAPPAHCWVASVSEF